MSSPLVSVSIALAKRAAAPGPTFSKAGSNSRELLEKVSVNVTLSSIAIKYPSTAILMLTSGKFAVNHILALADSSCFNVGIPNSSATLLSFEKVPTSSGLPSSSNCVAVAL